MFAIQHVQKLPHDIQETARHKLKFIDVVIRLEELRLPPGNRLKLLTADRAGPWSIRINDQWRICFRWEDGHTTDVEIVDYHQENKMSIQREELNAMNWDDVATGEKLAPVTTTVSEVLIISKRIDMGNDKVKAITYLIVTIRETIETTKAITLIIVAHLLAS